MQKDNSIGVLTRFMAKLAIPVTGQSISDQLEKHPDYDSLLAFSDVLDFFRVPNAAYRLQFDELPNLPLPFIAHINNKQFAVVTELNDEKVILADEKWGQKTLKIDEFKKKYSGSVLVAENDELAGEADFKNKHLAEVMNNLRLPVALCGGLVLLLSYLLLQTTYLTTVALPLALLTLFKTAGLITAILLLIQSIDANNPLIQKLCGSDDNKDCNAILSSKAAKVNAYLSWSETGFFYFAGTWLVLLFQSGHPYLLWVLALLNIVGLPYTFYSIYYQWRVAKQWCIFCCTVQAILWLEFFAFLPYLTQGFHGISLTESSSLLIGMAAPVLAWIFIKPYLLQAKQITPLKQQLRRFKYNKDLFERMLHEEVKYTLPSDENSLIIGNREAENIITMVSNPYCQPCSKAHKALDEWLVTRPDLKLQVIFYTSNTESDKKTEVAAHLMNLQYTKNDVLLKNALDDWYEQKQKNYTDWAKNYPVEKTASMRDQLEAQKEWCALAEIKSTPTLFLNGRRLPKTYQPEDLKYFI